MAPLLLHRTLLAAAIAACGLAVGPSRAHAQLLEFTGAELRGRIDRPGMENVWTYGDANGNGALDDDEQFGTQIDVDKALLEAPGTVDVAPEPSPLQRQADRTQFQLNPVFSEYGSMPIDYDDIVLLPRPLRSLTFDSYAGLRGAQLMQVLCFHGEPQFTFTGTDEKLELGYGIRYYSALQEFRVSGSGGVLGDSFWDSSLDSQAAGPQLSLQWTARRGRWQTTAGASGALTYLNIDGDQDFGMAEDAVPGQHNRGLHFASTAQGHHEMELRDVSPTLEASVRASYDVTSAVQCFIRCDAIQFGNLREVEDAVVYLLPSMGLRDPGGRDVTLTAASVGLEVRR